MLISPGQIDRPALISFFNVLCPDEDVTFQVFSKSRGARQQGARAGYFTGAPSLLLDRLERQGVARMELGFMVNEGDGHKRNNDCVRRIRSLVLDLDGAPLEPVLAVLAPSAVVESSPGRFHVFYYLAPGCPVSVFTDLQKALAERFDGDSAVCQRAQVMRLPGTWNWKRAEPFMAHIVSQSDCRFDAAELVEKLGLSLSEHAAETLFGVVDGLITAGRRNAKLFKLGCGLAEKGLSTTEVRLRLALVNERRCRPALPASELDDIAANAVAQASKRQSVTIPRWIQGELHNLKAAQLKVLLQAVFLTKGGRTATTLAARDVPCVSARALCSARSDLVEAGLLVRVGSVPTSAGCSEANLYRLATKAPVKRLRKAP